MVGRSRRDALTRPSPWSFLSCPPWLRSPGTDPQLCLVHQLLSYVYCDWRNSVSIGCLLHPPFCRLWSRDCQDPLNHWQNKARVTRLFSSFGVTQLRSNMSVNSFEISIVRFFAPGSIDVFRNLFILFYIWNKTNFSTKSTVCPEKKEI